MSMQDAVLGIVGLIAGYYVVTHFLRTGKAA